MAGSGEVISHWYHGFDGYNTSARDFYATVEEAVKRRGIPDVQFSRVDHAEGGVLSAKREYLRVMRDKLSFDICAAPFGKGYFFSWWLTQARGPWLVVLILTFIADVILGLLLVKMLGFRGAMLAPFLQLGALAPIFMGFSHMLGWRGRDVLFSIPYVGPVLEKVFSPDTYFKIDTTLMYQEAVRGAVMEALDQLVSQQGLRALTPEERLPKMRDLAK